MCLCIRGIGNYIYMAVLCGMLTIQYSAWLSVQKLFTSCIRRGLVSRDSMVDGDWLPETEWRQRYLPGSGSAVLSTRVGRRRKFGEVSHMECINERNDFELIPTVQMESKNPMDGYFGSEFPAICNHCGVMAAWSRKTLKLQNFCIFAKNDPLQ